LLQLVRSLRQAIMPQPGFSELAEVWKTMQRKLREPPRKKRSYQQMVCLS
jgi:hypothetical protein